MGDKNDKVDPIVSTQISYICVSFIFSFAVIVLNRYGAEGLYYCAIAALIWKIKMLITVARRRKALIQAVQDGTDSDVPRRSWVGMALDRVILAVLGATYIAQAIDCFAYASSQSPGAFSWALGFLAGPALADGGLVVMILYATVRYEVREDKELVQKLQVGSETAGSDKEVALLDLEAQTQTAPSDAGASAAS